MNEGRVLQGLGVGWKGRKEEGVVPRGDTWESAVLQQERTASQEVLGLRLLLLTIVDVAAPVAGVLVVAEEVVVLEVV
jgi:hypothetical protein